MSFAIFDESYYLAINPDVQAVVNAGVFSSGREHFELYGLAEGRVQVSPLYNEQFYLQNNPDVAAAVAARVFSSGLQHYIQYGEAEGRSPNNPNAIIQINGTTEIITASGLSPDAFDVITGINQTTVNEDVNSLVVAGGNIDGGSADYALVQNFEPGKNYIGLLGSLPDYNLQTVEGSLSISTASGDRQQQFGYSTDVPIFQNQGDGNIIINDVPIFWPKAS